MIKCIAGATASGKSKVGEELLKSGKYEIINADSRQVFSGLPILTAQPEIITQKHHLYSIINSEDDFSVLKWLDLVNEKIKEVQARGLEPVLIGGTGFYINALSNGIAKLPELSKNTLKELESKSEEEVSDELRKHDEEAYILFKDNRRRSKALGYILQEGESIIKLWQKTEYTNKTHLEIFNLEIEKDELLKNIESRLFNSIDEMIEEVKNYNLKNSSAIGFKEIQSYNKKEITKEELLNLMLIKTRQYAKRQKTYFNNKIKNKKTYKSCQDLMNNFEV